MINFPTSLDNFTNPTGTDLLENSNAALDHDVQHSNANDAIEALQAKVGVDGSAVTTSHDYKLSEVTSTDKSVGKTATQTLTNKTLTSPTITGATITTSTVNGVTLSSTGSASNFLKENGTYGTASAGDASYIAKGSVQGLTDAATSGLTIAAGVISVNSGTAANNIVKLDASAKLPAVDGSALTNIANPAVYKSGNTSYNLTTASGTQTIAHGLGKTPKYVRISFILSQTNIAGTSGIANLRNGVGTFNGTTYATWYTGTQSGDTSGNYTTIQTTSYLVAYEAGSGGSDVSQKATAALDSTNITLTWTKTASPSGTLLMTWEAFA